MLLVGHDVPDRNDRPLRGRHLPVQVRDVYDASTLERRRCYRLVGVVRVRFLQTGGRQRPRFRSGAQQSLPDGDCGDQRSLR